MQSTLISTPQDMSYTERKRRYAQVGRIVRARGVDAAVVAKYEYLKSDGERSLVLSPNSLNLEPYNPKA